MESPRGIQEQQFWHLLSAVVIALMVSSGMGSATASLAANGRQVDSTASQDAAAEAAELVEAEDPEAWPRVLEEDGVGNFVYTRPAQRTAGTAPIVYFVLLGSDPGVLVVPDSSSAAD